MTVNYIWTITQLECKPEENEKKDVVVTAHWTICATDGTNNASVYGSQGFTLNPEAEFIPFEQLTEVQIVEWVKEAMGVDAVISLQENLDKQIDSLANPPIVKPPLPWSA